MKEMDLPSAEVVLREGASLLLIDGEETPALIYGLSDIPGSRCHTEQARHNIANFVKAGIRLVQCDWNLRDGWTRDNRFDLTGFISDIEPAVRENPSIRLIVRIHTNPPEWWLEEHPDDITVFGISGPVVPDDPERLIANDGKLSRRVAFGSKAWLRDAGCVLRDFCRKLKDSSIGCRVIGMQPSCGLNGEWHWWGGVYDPDYSRAQTLFLREFLRKKYKTSDALKKAWNDESVNFENAEIATVKERYSSSDGIVRDPQKEQRAIDSAKAHILAAAEAVISFCRDVKESAGRPMLTGAFYGYFFGTGNRTVTGHLEIDRVLKSPYVDYVAAPAVYGEYRLPGSPCVSRGVIESCRLNGKLYLNEMDQRPEGVVADAPGGDPAKDGQTISMMRRNFMETFTRGMGQWFYDHRLVNSNDLYLKFGWWDTPRLSAEVAHEYEIARKYFRHPYRSEAEILCVWDTESFYHTRCGGEPAPLGWYELDLYRSTAASGAVCDHIFWNDLEKADLSRYRIVIVADKIMALPGEGEKLRERVLKDNRQLIFLYAAGYSDGKTLSAENISRFTGFKIVRSGFCSGFRLGDRILESRLRFDPLFRAEDEDAETAAFLGNSSDAAVVRKNVQGGSCWYFTLPYMSSEFLRERLRESGGHLYCEKDLYIAAGRGLISLHAPAEGDYTITLRNGKTVLLTMKFGETVILDAETGEQL